MNDSKNTKRVHPTLMHVVGLLFLAGWSDIALALGRGSRVVGVLLVLRNWLTEQASVNSAALLTALEALAAREACRAGHGIDDACAECAPGEQPASDEAVLRAERDRLREVNEALARESRGHLRDLALLKDHLREIELVLQPKHGEPNIDAAKRIARELRELRDAGASTKYWWDLVRERDELREQNAKQRTQMLRVAGVAREALGAGEWELVDEAAQRVATERDTAQALLDEAQAMHGAIWDAVGGQREGESLVDAVRRVVRLANDPGPRAEVSPTATYASYVTEADRRAQPPKPAQEISSPEQADALLGRRSEMAMWAGAAFRQYGTVAIDVAARVASDSAPVETPDREALGRVVHEVSCKSIAMDVDWEHLSESSREWRRVVGERLFAMGAHAARVTEADRRAQPSAQVEIDRQRDEIDRTFEALGAESTPGISLDVEARKRVADTVAHVKRLKEQVHVVREAGRTEMRAELDAAYQRGQKDMRERAAAEVADGWPVLAARVEALPIAKSPVASASEAPGEANPGEVRAAEATGAGESVAVAAGDASEAARMNLLICEASSALGLRDDEDLVDAAKRIAGECAEIERLRSEIERLCAEIEIIKASRDKARAAVLAIEKQWSDATACQTPAQARELLATLRAMPLRTDAAESDAAPTRAPQVGEVVVLASGSPAMIVSMNPSRGPYGSIDVRDMYTLEVRTVSARTSPITYRFRE